MSYLSRLLIDPLSPRAMDALSGPTPLHHAVYAAFPQVAEAPDGERKLDLLYRLEPGQRDGLRLLLVWSRVEPDWGPVLAAHFPRAGYQVRDDVDHALACALQPGAVLRFRLRANPTHNEPLPLKDGRLQRGKRRGVVGEADQEAWLTRKLAGAAELLDVLTVDEGLWQDRRPPNRELQSALFDGHLRVLDPDRLRVMVTEGVGRAKAFGFGLLSLAPA